MDRAAIGEQVERIQRSTSFAGKTQLAKLLEVLFARMDSQATLKPDCVIRELWPDETRTKRSADVATEMNRLRKALECYYHGEGQADPIVICLPNRSAHAADGPKEKRWIVAEPREAPAQAQPLPASQGGNPAANGSSSPPLPPPPRSSSPASCSSEPLLRLANRNRRGFDGSTLIVMNSKGEELWRKGFPEGFWPEYYSQGLAARMWYGELDGNGRTSVLFLYHPAISPISRSTTLICYSDRGKEQWRWTPGRDLPELAGNPPTYRTVGLGVLKATANRPPRIVVSSYHVPEYPNQIALLDANGKTVSEYWHSGHLDFLTLADIDGDGREEIIAPGISNGYRQATLVVLDPDKVFGASTEAARPEIQLHGMGAAQEKLRLLFPRSDLNKALLMYNQGSEASVHNGKTRLSVVECWQVRGCEIWYEFDKDFHLISVEAADPFRGAHAEFYLSETLRITSSVQRKKWSFGKSVA